MYFQALKSVQTLKPTRKGLNMADKRTFKKRERMELVEFAGQKMQQGYEVIVKERAKDMLVEWWEQPAAYSLHAKIDRNGFVPLSHAKGNIYR